MPSTILKTHNAYLLLRRMKSWESCKAFFGKGRPSVNGKGQNLCFCPNFKRFSAVHERETIPVSRFNPQQTPLLISFQTVETTERIIWNEKHNFIS